MIFKKQAGRKKKNPGGELLMRGEAPVADNGQVVLEFTFCMIIVLIMLFGITKILVWSGRSYAGCNNAHDETLYRSFKENYKNIENGPSKQIDPYFYTPVKMNAIWGAK
jgi:hypothetical protein